MTVSAPTMTKAAPDPSLSLYQLLDPAVLADPYPLYRRLREHDPVHWDAFLHAWVVTDYDNVLTVLHKFSADRTPAPDQIKTMGLETLEPIAQMMTKQMLFMDAPAHTRLRKLCSAAFTSRSVEHLRSQIQDIANGLVDKALAARPDGHRRRFRRAIAGDRHRATARRADLRPRAAQGLVRRFRRNARQFSAQSRSRPPRAAQRRGDDRLFQVGHPRAGALAARRPDPFLDDGGGRRRPADRGRSHRQHDRDHGRRAGDHHESDRQRPFDPAAQSRAVGAAPRRPVGHRDRRRGTAALRKPEPAYRAACAGRRRHGRQARSANATP